MPSWPIHIALANRLKNQYHLTDDFVLGNIMPDATNGFIIQNLSIIIAHAKTHYNLEGPGKPPKNNINAFLEDYLDKLDNPIILGSYIHLLTDNFYNEYFYKTHVDDKKVAILNDGSKNSSVTPWKLKQEEFRKYGLSLAYHNQMGEEIKKTKQTEKYVRDLVYTLSREDIDIIIDKVNSFITKDTKRKPNYKMFTQQELDQLLEDCYQYLIPIMDSIINK